MGLHLENEVAVVKIPTIISNNPVFPVVESHVNKHSNVFKFTKLL